MRERRFVTAAHHREHAVLGAGLAAGNRRIDEFEVALYCLGVQFARDGRRRRSMIDHHRAFFHAGKNAGAAKHDLAQIVVVADAGKHEILAVGGLLRRRRAFAAVLGDPFFSLGAGAVIDRDVMAALGLEMPRHRVTHDAEPDKCDLRHCFLHYSAWS